MAEKFVVGGITNTTMHFEEDGTIHVEEKQDAEGILDYAAAGRNNRFDANCVDGMMQHVAEVPMVEYIRWCQEANVGLFTPEADVVMELKLRDAANAKMLAAPKIRDPRVIIKGAR